MFLLLFLLTLYIHMHIHIHIYIGLGLYVYVYIYTNPPLCFFSSFFSPFFSPTQGIFNSVATKELFHFACCLLPVLYLLCVYSSTIAAIRPKSPV